MYNERASRGFLILSVIYVFMLTLANIMAGKIIIVHGVLLPAAIIVFPIVYIISDLMTEVYGMKLSMLSIRLNVLCCFILAVMSQALIMLPYPDFWQGQAAYTAVFKSTPRIIAASLIGYYFGDWLNSAVISYMKVKQQGKGFAIRAILSTMAGQVMDTGLFIVIAFYGTMPLPMLLGMVIAQYCAKVGYEILCVPITTKVVKFWKAHFKADFYDSGEVGVYNPFSITKE